MEPLAILLIVIGVIVLAVAVVTFLLSTSGRAGLAWMIPGAVAFVVLAMFVFEEQIHSREGLSGFVLYLILVLFFAPLFAGGLLGCLAGALVLWLKGREPRT